MNTACAMRFSIASALLSMATAETCKASCIGEGLEKECTFTAKLDVHASPTGYYKFEECGDDVMPTIEMQQGVTYRFVQNADSNWYHPLGFAYFPDGAHAGVDELEPGISQVGSTCAEDNTCQAPRYFMDGAFVGGSYDNTASPPAGGEDFGLDVYEPHFQVGRGDWQEYRDSSSGYEIQLTITDTQYTKDLFYFCHVHRGMSGRIVVVDDQGKAVNTEPGTPELYDHQGPSEFDAACGTFGTGDYQRGTNMCPAGDFVFCDASPEPSHFSSCMYALDCHMQHSMRVNLNADPMAAFMHQMIPHHENAVNMAKVLMKEIRKMPNPKEKDPEGEFWHMLYEIVHTQNKQITMMNGWLSEYGHDTSYDAQCGRFSEGHYSPVCCSRRLLFGKPASSGSGCLCG